MPREFRSTNCLTRWRLISTGMHNGGHASALYAGDKKTMESDQIFVAFMTGWDDAFVVEDADHLLRPKGGRQ